MIKHRARKRILTAFLAASSLMMAVSAHALELHGELIQGGMVWGQTDPNKRLKLDGKPVRISEDGLFVFGFGRDAKPQSTLEICQQDDCQQQVLSIQQSKISRARRADA